MTFEVALRWHLNKIATLFLGTAVLPSKTTNDQRPSKTTNDIIGKCAVLRSHSLPLPSHHLTNAPCSMLLNAQCSMLHAPCSMLHALTHSSETEFIYETHGTRLDPVDSRLSSFHSSPRPPLLSSSPLSRRAIRLIITLPYIHFVYFIFSFSLVQELREEHRPIDRSSDLFNPSTPRSFIPFIVAASKPHSVQSHSTQPP
ncbi:hypothetical protein ACMFMG_007912 [Clarireedia jacksonii]